MMKLLHLPIRQSQLSVVKDRTRLVVRAVVVDVSEWQPGGVASADGKHRGVQQC